MTISIYAQKPSDQALVPLGTSTQLPEETRAILEHFEVPGSPEMTEQLAYILTLDTNLSENDPRLLAVRQEQVAFLSPLIEQLRQANTENDFFLGFLLVSAATRNLHLYAGHTHFSQWCADLGVKKPLYERTTTRAQVWPYLHKLGYGMADIMDPGFDEEKLPAILGMARLETRELFDAQIYHLLHTHVELVDDLEGVEGISHNAKQKKLRQAMSTLPQDEQRSIVQASHQDYIDQKKREVESIRTMPIEDYIAEKNRKLGEPEKPYIVVEAMWRDGVMYLSPTQFVCEYAQVAAMKKNQANYRYRLAGEEKLYTLRELGDHLDTFVLPPYCTIGEEDDEELY